MFSIKLDTVFTIMFPFIFVLIVSSLTRTEGFQLNNSSFIYRDGNIAKNESDMLMKDDSSVDFLKREIEKDLAKLESSNSSTIELIDQASNSTGSKLQEILIEKLQENGNLEMSFSLPPITLDDPSEVKTIEMFDTNSDMDITDLLGQNMETQENQESPIMLRVSAIQKLNPQKRFQNEIKKGSQQNVTNLWSLEDLLDIYSPSRLVNVWNKSEELHLTDKCKKDMEDFLDGLENGDLWALQMTDASGRYGGSFLFGNSYWVGSATLCEQIHNMAFKPPFPLGFFMLRTDVMLNKTITAHVRSQLLGVCLPYACTSLDVDQIVALSAQEARLDSQRSLELVTIKSPHNIYNMNEDPVFIILIVSSAIVCILLAIGTGLDYYFEHKVANKSSFTYDNYSFVFSKSSHHRAIITGPTAVKVEANAENNNRNMVEAVPEGSEATTESNSVTSDETVIKTGLLSEIFLSFSVRRNMNTICDRSVGVDTIPTIHGLRSLSMAWVILGHTCIVAFKYSDNMSYRGVVEREFLFQTINNGAFSVDTFFFISGLLVSFLYFRTTAKNDFSELTRTKGMVTSFLHFIGMITYRFGRLSTPYLFVLGVVQISMKWFYYNSVFEPPAADHINCPNYWWRNLLYINTLFPVKDMCMLWSWYLADDTQFYVLGAVLLIMAVKNFRASASLLVLFLVSSWITTMYIAYTNQHMPNVDDPLALFDKIYDKPWTRLGPYLVGMSVGWILFKTDCKIKMNKLFVVFGWTCSTGGLLGLVYGLYESELHPLTAAAYSSLSHTVWALSLAWIVIACSTGYGGFVNSALSATILYPFSRVTYCAYLIHPIVIRIVTMKMDSPIHLGKDIVIILYLGQLVISYILAFVLSLAYEAPVVSLLKIVSPTKRKPKCSQ